MAANGSVDDQSSAAGELYDISDKTLLNSAKVGLDGSSVFEGLEAITIPLASRLASVPWITNTAHHNNNNNSKKNKVISGSADPLTFCSQDDPRRTLRIDRSGSTESVVTIGDSSSSEPGSPSRPVTPHLMTMAPVPAYECLRADSEDSGLGPSPAKSLTSPTSPEGSVSPIRLYDDRCSDSLLDLSPRTDNSSGDDLLSEDNHNGCCDTCDKQQTTTDAIIPSQLSGHPVVQGGSFHQFLLSASKNCVVNNSVVRDTSIVKESSDATTTEEDYRIRFSTDEFEGSSDSPASVQPSPSQEDEEEETFDCTSSSSAVVESIPPTDYVRQNNSSLLNPKVVLIRSDFGGQYAEESCSQQSSSVGTAASSVEDAAADCCPSTCEDGACKWLNCERSADANTTATDLIDHIRQCHVQNQPEDAESFVCLWVGCKVYAKPSCSRSWLERHVLLHGGSKPFRCIVAGCRQRFGSEAALQRHVNSHFPQAGKHHHPNHQHRLSRNRRRNFKLRRRPQSHKSKDFFDDATMEHVRHHLLQLSSIESVVTSGPPSAITFHSTITGKRINEAGKVNFLLRWSPENMVPDSWVSEEDLCRNAEKTIPISQLPPEALQPPVMDALGLSGAFSRPGKRKRK